MENVLLYPTNPDTLGYYFASASDEENGVRSRRFPTPADLDGFFVENEDDAEMEIFTKVYENGSRVKKTVLPASGRTAVVRELIAKDTKDIRRYTNGDPELYQLGVIAKATKLDGQPQPFEVFELLKLKDHTRLVVMSQALNF